MIDFKKIQFKTAKKMRYETCGDWQDNGHIYVYEKFRREQRNAIFLHELVEFALLNAQGVTQKMVDKWDTDDGDKAYNPDMYDADIRYKKAHDFATLVEKEYIKALGIDWRTYEKEVDAMEIPYDLREL